MQKKLIEVLATGFYLGRMPKAPGTFGTLLGIPLAYLLMHIGAYGYMTATMVFIVGAVFIADMHERELGTHDSSEIVIDEVAGYLVAITWLPMTWQSFAAAFVVFRIFDAVKPFPISYLDENIKGGLGVVVDDIAAGVITNILLQAVFLYTNWLGVQFLQ